MCQFSDGPPGTSWGVFAGLLRKVRTLTLRGYSGVSSPFPITLPALEELRCLQVMHEYQADPVRVTDFASQFSPTLCRILIYPRGGVAIRG